MSYVIFLGVYYIIRRVLTYLFIGLTSIILRNNIECDAGIIC